MWQLLEMGQIRIIRSLTSDRPSYGPLPNKVPECKEDKCLTERQYYFSPLY